MTRTSPSDLLGRAVRASAGTLAALRERHDLALFLALAALAAGGWAFAEVADAVVEGDGRAAEERLLLAFRVPGDSADPVGPVAVEEAVRDLTGLGGVLLTTLAAALGAAFFALDGRPRAAAFLAGSIAGGVAVTFALKAGFDRPRPDLVAHRMEALSASFPSGHSATAAVVYLTLGALVARSLPRVRLRAFVVAVAVALTLAIGASRVYLGVHWPTDVLAGWTVGAAWALATWLVERDLRRRGWVEPSRTLTAPAPASADRAS